MKITKINSPEEWTGKHGVMYSSIITLDDGTVGKVNMKKPDRWTVGDEVTVVECKETAYGHALRIMKPDGFTAPSSNSESDDLRVARITACWAISGAVKALAVELDPMTDGYQRLVYDVAKKLVVVRDQIAQEMLKA